jgi:hypothetical protein
LKALRDEEDHPLEDAVMHPLSGVDRKKIKDMMRSDPVQRMPEYVTELQTMLSGIGTGAVTSQQLY